jgi:hypothetical protein
VSPEKSEKIKDIGKKYLWTDYFDVFQIVFAILKLTNLVSWSWWWVLSPTIACVFFVILATISIKED